MEKCGSLASEFGEVDMEKCGSWASEDGAVDMEKCGSLASGVGGVVLFQLTCLGRWQYRQGMVWTRRSGQMIVAS